MSGMAHTPTQQEAIESLDRNVIVLASAGTGKTYVLIQRFLYLLEQNPRWPLASILAITFTKKAAQQMRTRLRAGIQDRIRIQGADAGWQQRLDELDHLQVSTVHSLCEAILHEHALEAGLDPDFRVLDELEASLLQEQALDAMFQGLEDRGGACLVLLDQYTLQDLRTTLQFMFQKRSTLEGVLAGKTRLDRKQWQADCLDLIHAERQAGWCRYQQQHPELSAAMDWLTTSPWYPPDDRMGEKVAPAMHAVRALGNHRWAEAISFLGEGGLGRMSGGTQRNWGSKEALANAKSHIKAVNDALKHLQSHSFHEQDLLDAREGPALALWLEARALAEKHYQALKQEQACLDFDDLELLTRNLLDPAQPDATGRMARWKARINHVLVDEHQDINPLQQQIINFLVPRAMPGKLFVVGDTKQSIYRFRQAQVTEFADLAVSLRQLTGMPEVQLHQSFRSHAPLIAATNHLFAHVLQPLNGAEYASYEAKPMALRSALPAPGPDPCVELHVVHPPDTAESSSPAHEQKLYEAQVLVQRIGQLQDAGRPVRDSDGNPRPLHLDDVVILMRSMGDLPLYEYVLRQAQMPYQVVTGTALKYQTHVRSLLALLKHLEHPEDDFNLAVALRSTLFGLSDATLYQLVRETRQQAEPLRFFPHLASDLTDQPDRVQQAGVILDALYPQVHVVPPDRLIQRILDATGYAATCMADPVRYRGVRHLEDIQAVRGYARQRQDLSLGEFLDHFEAIEVKRVRNEDENPAASARETGESAVRIMTIHAAKGLEFPVVCVPQLDRGLGGSRTRGAGPMVTFDPASGIVCQLRDERGAIANPLSYRAMQSREQQMEYAETKRVFYVACTRAADLLVMTGKLGKSTVGHRRGTNFSKNWITDVFAAFDLALEDFTSSTGQCRDFDGFQLGCFGYTADQPLAAASRHANADALPQSSGTRWTTIPILGRIPEQTAVPAFPQMTTMAMKRGTLVHNLLDPWEAWTEMSPAALQAYAVAKARQLHIWDEAIPRHLVSILQALRQTPEAHDITQAQERVSEMPVLATWAGRTRLLRLDLVYKDRQGRWNLVDWKTEQPDEDALEQAKQRHLPALAAYVRAFYARIGQYPDTRLCFLSPNIRWVPVSQAELRSVELPSELEPDI